MPPPAVADQASFAHVAEFFNSLLDPPLIHEIGRLRLAFHWISGGVIGHSRYSSPPPDPVAHLLLAAIDAVAKAS
jgi:hypothetical protein